MNIQLLEKRKRELCGIRKEMKRFDMTDTLAAITQLSIEHKPISERAILIAKMEGLLDTVPDNRRPFCEAILRLTKE